MMHSNDPRIPPAAVNTTKGMVLEHALLYVCSNYLELSVLAQRYELRTQQRSRRTLLGGMDPQQPSLSTTSRANNRKDPHKQRIPLSRTTLSSGAESRRSRSRPEEDGADDLRHVVRALRVVLSLDARDLAPFAELVTTQVAPFTVSRAQWLDVELPLSISVTYEEEGDDLRYGTPRHVPQKLTDLVQLFFQDEGNVATSELDYDTTRRRDQSLQACWLSVTTDPSGGVAAAVTLVDEVFILDRNHRDAPVWVGGVQGHSPWIDREGQGIGEAVEQEDASPPPLTAAQQQAFNYLSYFQAEEEGDDAEAQPRQHPRREDSPTPTNLSHTVSMHNGGRSGAPEVQQQQPDSSSSGAPLTKTASGGSFVSPLDREVQSHLASPTSANALSFDDDGYPLSAAAAAASGGPALGRHSSSVSRLSLSPGRTGGSAVAALSRQSSSVSFPLRSPTTHVVTSNGRTVVLPAALRAVKPIPVRNENTEEGLSPPPSYDQAVLEPSHHHQPSVSPTASATGKDASVSAAAAATAAAVAATASLAQDLNALVTVVATLASHQKKQSDRTDETLERILSGVESLGRRLQKLETSMQDEVSRDIGYLVEQQSTLLSELRSKPRVTEVGVQVGRTLHEDLDALHRRPHVAVQTDQMLWLDRQQQQQRFSSPARSVVPDAAPLRTHEGGPYHQHHQHHHQQQTEASLQRQAFFLSPPQQASSSSHPYPMSTTPSRGGGVAVASPSAVRGPHQPPPPPPPLAADNASNDNWPWTEFVESTLPLPPPTSSEPPPPPPPVAVALPAPGTVYERSYSPVPRMPTAMLDDEAQHRPQHPYDLVLSNNNNGGQTAMVLQPQQQQWRGGAAPSSSSSYVPREVLPASEQLMQRVLGRNPPIGAQPQPSSPSPLLTPPHHHSRTTAGGLYGSHYPQHRGSDEERPPPPPPALLSSSPLRRLPPGSGI